MQHYDAIDHINIGAGEGVSIRGLAEMIREVVHPEARIIYDASKPDGTPRKRLDVSKLHAMGWLHSIDLRQGIEETYRWFVDHTENARQPARGTAAR